MPRTKEVHIAQGEFGALFTDYRIPRDYTVADAREAAKWPLQLADDELAMAPGVRQRSQTFRQRTGGLWVPRSRGELVVVVEFLPPAIKKARQFAHDRVEQKYEYSDVPASKVNRWATYSAQSAEIALIKRIRRYEQDAHFDFVKLAWGIRDKETLAYDYYSVRESQPTMEALARYLLDIRIHHGAEKPKYIQPHWRLKLAAGIAWAMHYLDRQPEHKFLNWYRSGIYSAWSRHLYWQDDLLQYSDSKLAYFQNMAIHGPPPPMSVYDRDPEAQDWWVDPENAA